MSKIIINGSFLCRNLTGIERFSWELCKQLDSLIQKDEIAIYIPENAKTKPVLKNIKCIISKKVCSSFPLWDHCTFPLYVRKQKAVSLDFSNLTSLFHPGLVFIHDIYAKLYPQDFTSKKDKLRRFYMCWMYKHAVKKGKLIFTVSNFSKNQICKTYQVPESKVKVIPNGWDHFSSITTDDTIYTKFPALLKTDFFFTLGSLQKRKNLKWISEYAKKHPSELFAISGKAISGMVSNDIKDLQKLKNVILLGYVTDEEVKALMKKCKAFVFPSYYEGFGIPPLEALSVGAKIIISEAACLPEIYKDCAYYINPDDSDCDLSEILKEKVISPEKILSYYTYKNAAKIFYKEIHNL